MIQRDGDLPDDLDIHPMSLRLSHIPNVQRLSVKHHTRPRSCGQSTIIISLIACYEQPPRVSERTPRLKSA